MTDAANKFGVITEPGYDNLDDTEELLRRMKFVRRLQDALNYQLDTIRKMGGNVHITEEMTGDGYGQIGLELSVDA